MCQVNEKLVLVDGEHRLDEAKNNLEPMIEVVVFEGDMVDVLTKNLFLDHLRGKTPVSDMVQVIGALYKDYNLDPDQISERAFKSRDYVEKLIKISQASPVVQKALDEGWIGVGIAFELSRIPSQVVQEEIIAKQQVYHFSVKELHDQIDKILIEMKALEDTLPGEIIEKARPVAVYHCEGCKDQVEQRYLRPVMLCPDCFGAVWKLAKSREAPKVEVGEETERD